MPVVAILALVLLAVACGGTAGEPETQPGQPPPDSQDSPDASADAGSDVPPASPAAPGPGDLTGTLGGDAELEGGCAWVEARGERYEVLYPQGYEVQFDPLRLLGPDGEVVAAAGDPVTLDGAVATDFMSFCQIGPIFQATAVRPG